MATEVEKEVKTILAELHAVRQMTQEAVTRSMLMDIIIKLEDVYHNKIKGI